MPVEILAVVRNFPSLMNIIEQIEIKNFRSFGNRIKETNKLVNCSSLNIISGANDSGKSNILRALNLFFNKQTNLNQFFDFDRDFFNKNENDENEIKEELITIKIWFHNPQNSKKNLAKLNKVYLPEHFWVSRKFKKSSEFSQFTQVTNIELAFEKEKGENFQHFLERKDDTETIKSTFRASLTRQLTDFINSIQFHYVPAIKDISYYSHLYGELQQTLYKSKLSSVEKSKDSFEKAIQDETNQLMDEFKQSINTSGNLEIEPVFQLPSNLINLFRALIVQTGNVDLTLRGDGFQAKLIPEILHFIAKKELQFTSKSIKSQYKSKKYFIWGFEEPENSYEYKNAKILAEKFKDIFSQNAQIFITTHSFNFLSLNGEKVETFRIWKDSTTNSSKITKVKRDKQGRLFFDSNFSDSDWELLQEELGFFYLSEDLNSLYEEKQKQIKQIREEFARINKPIIYSEGKNHKFMKRAKEIYCPQLEIDILDAGGKNELKNYFDILAKNSYSRYKAFFVFDCDAQSEYSHCNTSKTSYLIPYIFPKNKNNSIPEVQSGIENLFNDDIFNSVNEYEIFELIQSVERDGTTKPKNKKIRKTDFERLILEERNLDCDFINFQPLFEFVKSELKI